ncbi:MAG: non-homologous end-joining DNA ligase [Acidimicrobiales bacterium]
MLAELARTVPNAAGWVFERKLDGLRCIAVRHGTTVDLWSRNRLSFNNRFPGLVEAIRHLPADDFVLDGEIVAMDAAGQTSFGLLQRRGSPALPELHVFDLLHLLGTDTRGLSLLERKALLSRAVPDDTGIHVVDHHEGDPEVLLLDACRRGWEGLMAKRAQSRYRSGRSGDWKKLKCSASQELVIGGWTEPRGARSGFGALLVGVYDPTGLRYAGKVGTGFDSATLASLYVELRAREVEASPFVERIREPTAHWVRPELVANVAFTEWTGDAKLRHPRFEGLRPDADPRHVVRERPVTT